MRPARIRPSMTQARFMNLACGATYVKSGEWLNLDYTPLGPAVVQANLLGRLPAPNASMDVVYSSHFIEHVPRPRVAPLLAECRRVLKPGGLLRLVVPDLLEMSTRYVQSRQLGHHDTADRLVLEMVDQCVRRYSGGELAGFYGQVRASGDPELKRWVFERSGETLDVASTGTPRSWSARVSGAVQRRYIRLLWRLMPQAFREQNVSLADVGELHAWLYDAHSLGQLLLQAGFRQVSQQRHDQSSEPGFPLRPLDCTAAGEPRKGLQSLYLEARA
jgi:SAM-dependent methyltransferase